jgi:hypothetical protein
MLAPARVQRTQALSDMDRFFAAICIELGDPKVFPPENRVVNR